MIHYKSKEEIELMRESCMLVGRAQAEIAKIIRPGISTLKLDKVAEEFILDNKGKPSFKITMAFHTQAVFQLMMQ